MQGWLAFLVSLLALVCAGHAAEWSKLKKCSDLGFCRRHRHYTAPADLVYKLSVKSLKVTRWDGQSAITGSVVAPSRPPLLLVITAFANGVFRILLDDKKEVKHERYSVKDVILPHVKAVQLKKELFYVDMDDAQLVLRGVPMKLVLRFYPFRVDLVRVSDEQIVTSLNAQSRLLVEDFPEKPTPKPSSSPSPDVGDANMEGGATPADDKSKDDAPASPTGESQNDLAASADKDENSDDEDDMHLDDDDDYDYVDSEKPTAEASEANADDSDCTGCWEERFQSHVDPKLRGPESVGVDITFPFARHIYGLPERTVSLSIGDTVGAEREELSEPYRMYNLDVFEFELDKPLGLYGAIPFLMARDGKDATGMLWLNSAETYVDVIKSSEETGKNTHWYSETGKIDVYLMGGPSASHIFKQYLWLTGAPAMPQRFALGYHQCRWNYRDDEDARAVDSGFDERDIPYDVLWLDIEHTDGKRYFTWDLERFPDPTGLQKHIAARGRKMVTIIDPHVKRDNKYALHRLAQDQKLYVMKPDGKPYDGWCWPGSSSYFDFTSSRVREAWAARFNPRDYPHFTEHLYTWNDMNEPSVFNGPEGTMPKDMIHEGNVEHRHVHNIFGHYFMQATFEGLLKGHGGNDRPFVLSRSFFAGSQRYGAIWTGDNTATWDHLESSVRMLLSLQISGMVFSGADVGGFFGNPAPELLTRWYQVGAFQPFFRGHAHLDTNRREPWLFGEPYTRIISDAIRTRYQYIPFWYTLFAGNTLGADVGFRVSSRGPPMRPMWWDFSTDAESDTKQRQWMVGNALLVAPVMEEGAATHKVYLPKGERWFDLYAPRSEGKLSEQGGEVELSVTLDRKVVFQRGGTIVPKQERRRRSTAAMARDPYTLVVALSDAEMAAGELYLDDGRSYDHESGSYSLRRFTYKQDELTSEMASGGEKEFDGLHALIERVVILGYGGRSPKSVVVEDRELSFVLAKDTGVLMVQRVQLPASVGTWTMKFER